MQQAAFARSGAYASEQLVASCVVQIGAARAPQWNANIQDMRILLIPLMLMVAVVVALALMATSPRASDSSDAVTRTAKP